MLSITVPKKESPLCCELPLVSPLMAFSELQEYLASNEESLGVFREFLGLCISLQPHFQSLDQNIVNVCRVWVFANKACRSSKMITLRQGRRVSEFLLMTCTCG